MSTTLSSMTPQRISWRDVKSRDASSECTVHSTCPYCGVGCGVVAKVVDGKPHSIIGDVSHPANFGRLCSKGAALIDTLEHGNRLNSPRIDDKETDWDPTIEHISTLLSQTIEQHGPESIAFYVSGQLLTEDYYVVNKFVKGYLGTANIDTNSRLCMASSVAAHKRAFGSDTVPGTYEDLEHAELVILTGSNLAWCHPVLFQRLQNAKQQRPAMQIVVIDPRQTPTAEIADLHLPIEPGSDRILFNGLLHYLVEHRHLNIPFTRAHANGLNETLSAAAHLDVHTVAEQTGLSPANILKFFNTFVNFKKVVTVYSQGINQSEVGTDTVNSIINCHLATGKIGKPGSGPFSVTGQPNAMGGREVGGLANMLTCHMDIENQHHRSLVQAFWKSPSIAETQGPKAIDLFKKIKSGQIKLLWVMATNPVDSLPEADSIKNIVANIPNLIVSDVINDTDTAEHAHILLPALAWGEKDGTVTNSERRISRQRALQKGPTGARPDWWVVAKVAQKMGFDGFDFDNSAAVFREYAALSAFGNNDTRDFDIGACATLSDGEYDAMRPFQWPWKANTQANDSRFFGDGRFYTEDRKARFIPITSVHATRTSEQRPYRLNTGRIRDQWHTMTRTGYSDALSTHCAEPYVEIHPDDAAELGIGPADIVNINNENGSLLLRATLSEKTKRKNVFVPIHWSGQFASNARVDTLVSSVTDPISGQPAFKSEAICVSRWQADCYGFVVTRSPLTRFQSCLKDTGYWATAKCTGGWRTEFASKTEENRQRAAKPAETFEIWKRFLTGTTELTGNQTAEETEKNQAVLTYSDETSGQYRLALYNGEKLELALFLSKEPVQLARNWAADALQQIFETPASRLGILSSASPIDRPDRGAIVCSCHQVGINQINTAITEGHVTVEALGQCLRAGTNCGACRTELAMLAQQANHQQQVA